MPISSVNIANFVDTCAKSEAFAAVRELLSAATRVSIQSRSLA